MSQAGLGKSQLMLFRKSGVSYSNPVIQIVFYLQPSLQTGWLSPLGGRPQHKALVFQLAPCATWYPLLSHVPLTVRPA